MFDENFTFDAPARSPSIASNTTTISSTREPSRSVSPCSPTGPFPPPRFSVTDLAATFGRSRLRNDSQICYDSCDAYANTDDDDAGWAIPAADDLLPSRTSRSRTFPLYRPHSPSRRAQRQLNTRLLCTMSHAKDVADLVSRMVECNDQCTILAADPIQANTEDDEGYNSSDAPSTSESRRQDSAVNRMRLEYRRSSEFRTTGACVSKYPRMRKRTEKEHKRPRTSESES